VLVGSIGFILLVLCPSLTGISRTVAEDPNGGGGRYIRDLSIGEVAKLCVAMRAQIEAICYQIDLADNQDKKDFASKYFSFVLCSELTLCFSWWCSVRDGSL